jgi:hypothetical protein
MVGAVYIFVMGFARMLVGAISLSSAIFGITLGIWIAIA